MLDHVGDSAARLDRVETEVSTIRGEMADLKADVKGLGSILNRIEAGVTQAQQRADTKEERGRPSMVAVITVLITVISIVVGGAWLISGNLARLEERSAHARREADRMWLDIDRNEKRHYESSRGVRGYATD